MPVDRGRTEHLGQYCSLDGGPLQACLKIALLLLRSPVGECTPLALWGGRKGIEECKASPQWWGSWPPPVPCTAATMATRPVGRGGGDRTCGLAGMVIENWRLWTPPPQSAEQGPHCVHIPDALEMRSEQGTRTQAGALVQT